MTLSRSDEVFIDGLSSSQVTLGNVIPRTERPTWPVFEFNMTFNEIHPAVLHLLLGCPRPYPHDGVECCFSNIILGQE